MSVYLDFSLSLSLSLGCQLVGDQGMSGTCTYFYCGGCGGGGGGGGAAAAAAAAGRVAR